MINIPKGVKDMLPAEAYKWHFVEGKAREIAATFGYKEIRTPTFEHTELFQRGVGETTDIVSKEMYTFIDKGDRSITLKPEGTAGVARSFVENSLYALPQPVKMYYITPVFRYERPQAGRLREHHQFGVEVFGSDSPLVDVEVIMLAKSLFDSVGLTGVELNLNNIGCPVCRAEYNKALKAYFAAHIDEMCETCKERLDKNPLRILDCKVDCGKEVFKNAPKIGDYLCDDCKAHKAVVEDTLTTLGVPFKHNENLVRGLDYYTRTVFEFISTDLGAQGTVCGGGRYNYLVDDIGGKHTPAAGFGMGLERFISVLEAVGLMCSETGGVKVYLAPVGDAAVKFALDLVYRLRGEGISADTDYMERSVKSQMKFADKLGADYAVVLGDKELDEGIAQVKNMKTGEVSAVVLDNLVEYFRG